MRRAAASAAPALALSPSGHQRRAGREQKLGGGGSARETTRRTTLSVTVFTVRQRQETAAHDAGQFFDMADFFVFRVENIQGTMCCDVFKFVLVGHGDCKFVLVGHRGVFYLYNQHCFIVVVSMRNVIVLLGVR
jgi:hypothetical protein